MKKQLLYGLLSIGTMLAPFYAQAQQATTAPAPAATADPKPENAGSGSLNVQVMTRTEYSHGYKALADTSQPYGLSTGQRARLGYNYSADKFKMGVAFQDIRTWGSSANGVIDTTGRLSLFEGWGELLFNSKASFKFGRQALSYDDDRILGSLDWAMQARRHDLGLFKYVDDSVLTVHVGVAYNQDRDNFKSTVYNTKGNYKAMQFLWLFRQFKSFNVSALFLNNGVQFAKVNGTKTDYSIVYSQTAGARTLIKAGKLQSIIYGYYQFGKDGGSIDKNGNATNYNAYDVSAELSYKLIKNLGLTLGGEVLSGTTQNKTATPTTNFSFNPFYGTNHRFNGYMDYFYVGNHVNSVGLQDIYFKVNTEFGKVFASVNAHMFSAIGSVKDVKKSTATDFVAMDANLGTEIDFTCGYNFTDNIGIQGGYSQMFGTETMVALRGGNTSQTSNWAYVMILIRPGKVKFPKTGLKF